MTRFLAGLTLALALLAILYVSTERTERNPLLIDAGLAETQRLFAPCPLSPQNVPPIRRETFV